MRSEGRPRMNCRIRNTPSGLASAGRISAQYVSSRPNILISVQSGTIRALRGTMSRISMRRKMIRFPVICSLASAYPAIESIKTLIAATEPATISVFSIHRRN